jgi:hypothetical protein
VFSEKLGLKFLSTLRINLIQIFIVVFGSSTTWDGTEVPHAICVSSIHTEFF